MESCTRRETNSRFARVYFFADFVISSTPMPSSRGPTCFLSPALLLCCGHHIHIQRLERRHVRLEFLFRFPDADHLCPLAPGIVTWVFHLFLFRTGSEQVKEETFADSNPLPIQQLCQSVYFTASAVFQYSVLPRFQRNSSSCGLSCPWTQVPIQSHEPVRANAVPSVEHGILAAEDLRWLPKQRSREVRYPQTCWNPDATEKRRPVLTSCAQDEVVEVAFALSHHDAINIAETPATALAALARQGRGEVRVSTLTPQEREELVKAKQKEISSFLKHAAVEAATRSGLQCKSLMRMRWVITRKSDDSLTESSFGDTGIH